MESPPRRFWHLFFIWLVLSGIIYCIPHTPNLAMQVHCAIGDSLLAGNNWGRQALVGSLVFPPLQTLACLFANGLARLLHLNGAQLMVSLCQGGFFMLLVRPFVMNPSRRRYALALLPFLVMAVHPMLRKWFLTQSPNWLVAVPAAGFVSNLIAWKDSDRLTYLILASVDCGFLCLCGLDTAVAGVLSAITLYYTVRAKYHAENQSPAGMRTLLWASPLYALLLWVLWNWLIMEHPFYALSQLTERLPQLSRSLIFDCTRKNMALLVLVLTFAFPLSILITKTDGVTIAKCLFPLGAVSAVFGVLLGILKIPHTNIPQLASVYIIGTIVLNNNVAFKKKVPQQACHLLLILCLSFSISSLRLFPVKDIETFVSRNHPPREELLALIDQHWADSRVMLYGMHAPALYSDPAEKRFIARLDYQEDAFIRQSKAEQLHLLVPPDNGIFYPLNGKDLHDIHRNGRPFLLLEKTWPTPMGTWKLWRSVIPPANESRLDFMR